MRTCWLCGRNGACDPLDEHHIFEGVSGRVWSEQLGLTVDLCHNSCHIFGKEAAHNCRETADALHRYGQRKCMIEQGWTVEEFRLAFGRNYLDEDEIEEIYAIQRGERTVEYNAEDFREDEEALAFPAWCA